VNTILIPSSDALIGSAAGWYGDNRQLV